MGYHKDDPLFFCIFGKNEEKISKNLKNLESTRIKTPYLLFIVKKYGVLSTLCTARKIPGSFLMFVLPSHRTQKLPYATVYLCFIGSLQHR